MLGTSLARIARNDGGIAVILHFAAEALVSAAPEKPV